MKMDRIPRFLYLALLTRNAKDNLRLIKKNGPFLDYIIRVGTKVRGYEVQRYIKGGD